MPLIAAKCTQCGAVLQVDNSQDAAICSHCGTPFIVEKAINNYNTSVVNNITTDKVVVSTDGFTAALDKIRFYNQMERWEDAEYEATSMMENYPSHPETWYEAAVAKTKAFSVFPSLLPLDDYLLYVGRLAGEQSYMYQHLMQYYLRNKEYLLQKKYALAEAKMKVARNSYNYYDVAKLYKEIYNYADSREKYEICIQKAKECEERENERKRKELEKKELEEKKYSKRLKWILIILGIIFAAIIVGGYAVKRSNEHKRYLMLPQEYHNALETGLEDKMYKIMSGTDFCVVTKIDVQSVTNGDHEEIHIIYYVPKVNYYFNRTPNISNDMTILDSASRRGIHEIVSTVNESAGDFSFYPKSLHTIVTTDLVCDGELLDSFTSDYVDED